jgi:hypothetical protein
VIFATGGTAAWKVQAWRITNIKAEHAVEVADAKERVNAAEKANQLKQIEAQNAKTKRDTTIQNNAVAVRNERYGLRDTTSAFIAKSTESTCNERASAVAVVFDNCAGRLEDMAKIADGLASDRQLLIDSWPK